MDIILEDKWIQTGNSPIYDKDYNEVGKIEYNFFSMRDKIEIFDENNEFISYGKLKLLTFKPKWLMFDKDDNQVGMLEKQFAFFKSVYKYFDRNNVEYKIEGDIFERNFTVSKDGKDVITVDNLSSWISLKPHTFAIHFEDSEFDKWEAVNIVQGVRAIVKRENENNN